MLLNIKTDFDLVRLKRHKKFNFMQQNHLENISLYTAKNTFFLIHVNTDNDKLFSLFDCLLDVLIMTFSVCGISYYRWFYLQGSTLYL